MIFPIDGLANMVRGNSDFTCAIALEQINEDGSKETISVAVSKIIEGEIYYAEKGFGAYLNNRRIRVSKIAANDLVVASSEEHSFFTKENLDAFAIKNFSHRNHGSRTLEAAYLASSQIEMAVFRNWKYEIISPFFLLFKEAGGKFFHEKRLTIATNSLINKI